jgi:putative endonuclease
MTSYSAGLFSEFLARWYLRLHGFSIVRARHVTGARTGRAEIDIIARRGNLMIFVEVKKRKSDEVAFDAISYAQAARLRRAAETYIARAKWRGDTRFDVIAVCGRRVRWHRGAI